MYTVMSTNNDDDDNNCDDNYDDDDKVTQSTLKCFQHTVGIATLYCD